jgi:NAD(P)H-flavin reductase
LLHEAEQAGAVAAGRLDSDALQLSEGTHPGQHLAIALPSRGEGSRSNDPILFVDDRCDVKILVGIDAADDATYSFDDRHSQPPG